MFSVFKRIHINSLIMQSDQEIMISKNHRGIMAKIFLRNLLLTNLMVIFIPTVGMQKQLRLLRQLSTKPLVPPQVSAMVREYTDLMRYDTDTTRHHEGTGNCKDQSYAKYIAYNVSYLNRCASAPLISRAAPAMPFYKQVRVIDYCTRKAGLRTPRDYLALWYPTSDGHEIRSANYERYLVDKTAILADAELFPVLQLTRAALDDELRTYYEHYGKIEDNRWVRDLRGWRLGAGLKQYYDAGERLAGAVGKDRVQKQYNLPLTAWLLTAGSERLADYEDCKKFAKSQKAKRGGPKDLR